MECFISVCLIWLIYDSITEQIRTYLGLLHTLGKVHLRIDWINIHFIHITSCFSTSHMISSSLQLGGHLSCTPGWVICMEMIDNLFTSQFSKMKKNIIGWQKRVILTEMDMLVSGLQIYWRMGSMRLGKLIKAILG